MFRAAILVGHTSIIGLHCHARLLYFIRFHYNLGPEEPG